MDKNKEIHEAVRALCAAAGKAAPTLGLLSAAERNNALCAMADELRNGTKEILAANAGDLENAAANGVPSTMLDRLRLTAERIEAIANAITELVALPDPLAGSEEITRPSGITIRRVRAPLGVVAIIFEARPNVTADAAAIAIKSGKLGPEAEAHWPAIQHTIRNCMMAFGHGAIVLGSEISGGIKGGVIPGMLEIANGHFFKGLLKMITG